MLYSSAAQVPTRCLERCSLYFPLGWANCCAIRCVEPSVRLQTLSPKLKPDGAARLEGPRASGGASAPLHWTQGAAPPAAACQ